MPEGYGYTVRPEPRVPRQAPETDTERIGGPVRLEAQRLQRTVADLAAVERLLAKLFSGDSLLDNYALFTSPRANNEPGRYYAPAIDFGDATTYSLFEFPASSAAAFPRHRFGVRGNTGGAKQVQMREENALLWTLAHGTIPAGISGFGPLLMILDVMLAPQRRDLWDASPGSWIGLCEERVSGAPTLPSAAAYGALLGLTTGPGENWKAIYRSDAAGTFQTHDLGIVPVNDEYHRWTWAVEARLANGGAGVARLFYDTVTVFEMPTSDLPGAATFLAARVACPTDAGSNDKGWSLGHLQMYHTRSLDFRPW